MSNDWKSIVWSQFGAAIDTLENAIIACPEERWADNDKKYIYWYWTFHTLFWLDHYLTEDRDNFTPPPPFGMEEMDPAGVMPERTYTKEELLTYLRHGRKKCRQTILGMTDELAERQVTFGRINLAFGELLLYNLRHVQHHAAQLNLILRQEYDIGSRWVLTASKKITDNLPENE